jgi:transglutaminase-like putative cysteine protease
MQTETVPVRGSITQKTLKVAQGLVDAWAVHPFIVQLARAVVDHAGALTPLDESRAVWAFVRRIVTYRLDPVGAEWVQDPMETLINSHAGDCDDMAVAAGTLLQAIGHPCRIAAVEWAGRGVWSHCVALDKMTGKTIDAVSPVFEPWPANSRMRVASILEA